MSKWKDQFAKRYWWCEVWRNKQGKTIYTSNHISKNCRLLYIPKKNSAPVCFCFCSFVCFFYCAFMRKVLADFSYKPLALLYVIRSFYPLECNFYYLVKRKGAEHTWKYFQISSLNFFNNWRDIPWSWYVSPSFARSFGISRLVLN